jgi:hypothetical protein
LPKSIYAPVLESHEDCPKRLATFQYTGCLLDRRTDASRCAHDLRSCLANRVQLTMDGHKPNPQAVEESFGADIDYAMLVKPYGEGPKTEARKLPGL